MMERLKGKLSAVLVIDGQQDDIAWAQRMDEKMLSLAEEHELVLIAQPMEDAQLKQWMDAIHTLPDATIHFLSQSTSPDAAFLIGMDNAIGDWVILLEQDKVSDDNLAALIEAARDGYDQAVLAPQNAPSLMRIVTRDAALYVLASRDGANLIRGHALAPGFPSRTIHGEGAHHNHIPSSRLSFASWKQAISGAVMIRVIMGLAGVSAVFNLVMLTGNLLAGDMARLQVSLTFLSVSLLFIVLGFYLRKIDAALPYRLKYGVLREIRSHSSRHTNRLNIVELPANFQVKIPNSAHG